MAPCAARRPQAYDRDRRGVGSERRPAMKRLSCWVGRHTWQTTVEEGYTMTSCSACGTMRHTRGGGPGGGPSLRSEQGRAEARGGAGGGGMG